MSTTNTPRAILAELDLDLAPDEALLLDTYRALKARQRERGAGPLTLVVHCRSDGEPSALVPRDSDGPGPALLLRRQR